MFLSSLATFFFLALLALVAVEWNWTLDSFLQCHLAAACPICDQWCLFFSPLSNLTLQTAVLGGWLPRFVFCLLVRLLQTGENTKSNLSVWLVVCVIFHCSSKSLLSFLTTPPTWGWKCVVSGANKEGMKIFSVLAHTFVLYFICKGQCPLVNR